MSLPFGVETERLPTVVLGELEHMTPIRHRHVPKVFANERIFKQDKAVVVIDVSGTAASVQMWSPVVECKSALLPASASKVVV